MDKQTFIKNNGVKEGAVILEDWDTYSQGITGVTDDGRVIYDYNMLAVALANSFADDNLDSMTEEEAEEFMTEAYEWLDFNTLGTLYGLPEDIRPVITGVGYGDDEDDDDDDICLERVLMPIYVPEPDEDEIEM